MLWAVDQNGLPCQLARFVRVAHQSSLAITDHSTFSREEVEAWALVAGAGGLIENVVYVQYDGFTPAEIGSGPSFDVRWADNNAVVPASDFQLVAGQRLQEVSPGSPDATQRITFTFHVRIHNMSPFSGFTDTRQIRINFVRNALTCSALLTLTHAPNPYMTDINVAQNNPHWLSTDLRVFSIESGQTKFGTAQQGPDNPIQFIRQCLDRLNDPNQNGSALFEALSTSAPLELATTAGSGTPVFNYAIARVRYRATTTSAQRVKCFFRLFNVAATGLEYDPNSTYRSTPAGPNTVPLLGVVGTEVASIPFFASERAETIQGRPGAASMSTQSLAINYEIHDIAPNPSGFEVTRYFGCWLDINQTPLRMPIAPGNADGPWQEAACRSIQELLRGRHVCLVSELFFQPDPTTSGQNPATSDNLSQRNLAILHSDNPGGPDSHTVMHPFELKPSKTPKLLQPLDAQLQFDPSLAKVAARERFGIDELVIRWHNLPPASEVKIYFSDIDTSEILALASLRNSPVVFDVLNRHTLSLKVAGATWIPIPGGRTLNLPALLSIKLPDDVTYGQEFRVSLHQVAGRTRQVIGACEVKIPVSKAELILTEELRTLSVFKHIIGRIPADNRWYPLMQRYVHHLSLKVDALGGKAEDVYPNPDGSGRPAQPAKAGPATTPVKPEGEPRVDTVDGHVQEVLYDCRGKFAGFTLRDCETTRKFAGCEPSLEQLILRACRERLKLRVVTRNDQLREVVIHCC
jgi:hypothetical protein